MGRVSTCPKNCKTKRNQQYRDIMNATTRYQKLFHKLIRQHQIAQSQANAIMVNDVLITDQDQAATEWAKYYEDLAMPKEKNIWDTDFLGSAEQQLQVACNDPKANMLEKSRIVTRKRG